MITSMPPQVPDPENLVILPPHKTDLELAQHIRDRLMVQLEPIANILSEASRLGLAVSFHFSPPDSFKRVTLAALEISKKLC